MRFIYPKVFSLISVLLLSACGGSDPGPVDDFPGGTGNEPDVNDSANMPPSLQMIENQVVILNTEVTIASMFEDPDDDVLTLSIQPRPLPAGLTFDIASGLLTGNPSEAGSTQLTITATDPAGAVATTTFTLAVVNTIPSSQLPLISSTGLVTWPFAPKASGLEVHIAPFVQMPPGVVNENGRWNDLVTLNERLFVLNEMDGHIFEITNGENRFWFDVSAAVQANTGRPINTGNSFHSGLRSVAFHPDFNSNGKFYTAVMLDTALTPEIHRYLSSSEQPRVDSALIEWTADPIDLTVDLNSYRELFRVGVPEYDHPIKQIEFNPYRLPGDPDYGLLYIAHGDGYHEENTETGGQQNDALGKILRINPLATSTDDYSIPADNPFVGDEGMLDEVYSLGHRNPHHLAFAKNHTLIVADVGRQNIDEINIVTPGGNYGWSDREGSFRQLSQGGIGLNNGIAVLPDDDALNGFTYPVAQFGHSGQQGQTFIAIALGGGFVVENNSPLQGEYFYLEFASTGVLLHSRLVDMSAAVTNGSVNSLTMAQTWRATVFFDHDNNIQTEAMEYPSLKEIIQTTGNYTGRDRLDIRIGRGNGGELYLTSKRNDMVYLVTSSVPGGPGGFSSVDTTDNDQPLAGGLPGGNEELTGMSLYEIECSVCHSNDFPDAPRFGDAEAWTALIAAKGIETLVDSVAEGLSVMPVFSARFSRDQLRAAVDYLVGNP